MVLATDGLRQTQTFSSADMAEENRLALRAGEMIRAGEVPGSYALYPIAQRLRVLAPQVAGLKTHAAECESIQRPSVFVCVCLWQNK